MKYEIFVTKLDIPLLKKKNNLFKLRKSYHILVYITNNKKIVLKKKYYEIDLYKYMDRTLTLKPPTTK